MSGITRTVSCGTFTYTCDECGESFSRQKFAEENAERLGLKIEISHRFSCTGYVKPTPRPFVNALRERQYFSGESDSNVMNSDFD